MALVIRTLALRACLLVGTYAVTRVGTDSTDVNLATHQIAITLWTFLAFALDAIAIAAQALTGRALGSGDVDGTRRLTRRMIRWGWGSGIVAGLPSPRSPPSSGRSSPATPRCARCSCRCCSWPRSGQPLAGVVFVLDGVLIGAGDGAYLAWAGLVVLAAYAPAALWAATLPHGLVAVWVAMTLVFMGARGVAARVARPRRPRGS